jgi:hypothetical protein
MRRSLADLTTFIAAADFSQFSYGPERGQSRVFESLRNAVKFAMKVLREPFRSTASIDLDGANATGSGRSERFARATIEKDDIGFKTGRNPPRKTQRPTGPVRLFADGAQGRSESRAHTAWDDRVRELVTGQRRHALPFACCQIR